MTATETVESLGREGIAKLSKLKYEELVRRFLKESAKRRVETEAFIARYRAQLCRNQ